MTVSLRQNLWLLHVTDGPVLMRVLFSSRAKKKKKKGLTKNLDFPFQDTYSKALLQEGSASTETSPGKSCTISVLYKEQSPSYGFHR